MENNNLNNLSLDDLANKYQTDKGTKYSGPSIHGYAPIYDKYLSKWRNEFIRMLEIGVCMESTDGGHSILMWNDYFQNAKIYTFDIVDLSSRKFIRHNNRVHFFQGNQENREDFIKMYEKFGNEEFDFIVEDGSHIHEHQIISLAHLFKYVKSGGYYILEDMSIPEHDVCCIRNDESYKILKNFKENGVINSPLISTFEKEYLEKNVEKIDIYSDIKDAYAVAIIQKK